MKSHQRLYQFIIYSQQYMRTYTLGIDLHKKCSVWVLIDGEYNEIWKESVACRQDHIITAISSLPIPPTEIRAALEPVCGWRWVMRLLEEAGIEVHPAHPHKVRLIAESTQKHDVGDARMLAGLLRSGYFPEARRVSDETHNLRTLLREREFLVRMRTNAKNRLHGLAVSAGCTENPLRKRNQATVIACLPRVSEELYALIAELDRRIAPLDVLCAERARREPLAPLLMSMPAIGRLTALTIIAEVERFDRFSCGGKLASYAGLVPRQRSSGKAVRLGSITNQGSPRLRTALVEAAMRVTDVNAPELYAVVARLTPVCGAKRARVALGRKMLVILWTMVRTQTPYRASAPSSACTANASDLVHNVMH